MHLRPKALARRFTIGGSAGAGLGVFARILSQLANEGQDSVMLMMDTTHLKAHRTASKANLFQSAVPD